MARRKERVSGGQDSENDIMSNASSTIHGEPTQNGKDGEEEIVTEGSSSAHEGPSQDDNGPPKVDTEVEVLHEKVTKQIIKEGHGEKPSKYSTCFLHYKAGTESTRHKFEDTWQELQLIEVVLGKGNVRVSRFIYLLLKACSLCWMCQCTGELQP